MLENPHRKRLNQLTKIKNTLSFYGSKFVLWTGFPFLLIYAFFNTLVCIYATLGASYIERDTELFNEIPILLPITQTALNIFMLLPIIAIIIFIIYSTIKILEDHYEDKLNEI